MSRGDSLIRLISIAGWAGAVAIALLLAFGGGWGNAYADALLLMWGASVPLPATFYLVNQHRQAVAAKRAYELGVEHGRMLSALVHDVSAGSVILS
ncbi:hypothetical protein GCM10023194_80900 [Planotetraspora phitsanulokensis]|uniref:Uncharacterized protein n=1 Tax=Planotetraspora phitsanulokensis TaxID=575192 RepID=A0A8J3UCB8_9ACTN|nr:hypothetical protein [Planotetraspora phitsanulokensis]GII42853.1 hypothetical protein Pph01_78560 [Planotetraspora phitsanulokensis]